MLTTRQWEIHNSMFRRPVEGKITININDGNPGEIGNWFELARVRVIIDLRRLLRMFWHPKIDNEQSRVLGGGGDDAGKLHFLV